MASAILLALGSAVALYIMVGYPLALAWFAGRPRVGLTAGASAPDILVQQVIALLRELGDENAYSRHLRTHGRKHSGAEWRRISDARGAVMEGGALAGSLLEGREFTVMLGMPALTARLIELFVTIQLKFDDPNVMLPTVTFCARMWESYDPST